MDTVTAAHLAWMSRPLVTGTLMLPEALLDTVLPRLANEPDWRPTRASCWWMKKKWSWARRNCRPIRRA